MGWNRDHTFTDKEIKHLAERGEIWRRRYFWNGKLEKVANCGIYECFCIKCGLCTVHFNRWTPEFNVCIPCHIKRAA